jgi:hypothetical protein
MKPTALGAKKRFCNHLPYIVESVTKIRVQQQHKEKLLLLKADDVLSICNLMENVSRRRSALLWQRSAGFCIDSEGAVYCSG